MTRRLFNANPTTTVLLALLVSTTGACIDADRWGEHNRQDLEVCDLDDQCESQICKLGRCQVSAGAPGLNCTDESLCDSGICGMIDGTSRGICLERCGQQAPRCPQNAACYQVQVTEGGAVKPLDLCLLVCSIDADCDSQASCVWAAGASAGYCFPR